jgi:hypothetical protein
MGDKSSFFSNGQILYAGGFPASQVPFGLVLIQNLFYLPREVPVNLWQTLGYVFMDRTFTNPKAAGNLANRRPGFQDVVADLYYPLMNIVMHRRAPFIFNFP